MDSGRKPRGTRGRGRGRGRGVGVAGNAEAVGGSGSFAAEPLESDVSGASRGNARGRRARRGVVGSVRPVGRPRGARGQRGGKGRGQTPSSAMSSMEIEEGLAAPVSQPEPPPVVILPQPIVAEIELPTEPPPPAPPLPRREEEKPKEDASDDDDELDDTFEAQTQNREAMKALLDTFTEEEMSRYETYRRSHLPKNAVKKLVQSLMGQPVPQNIGIIVGGVGKLFVGQMVEKAREVMEDWGDEGAIQPVHLREAYRRYRNESKTTAAPRYRPIFDAPTKYNTHKRQHKSMDIPYICGELRAGIYDLSHLRAVEDETVDGGIGGNTGLENADSVASEVLRSVLGSTS
ncbi:hypothetical protein HK102_008156 [Quaeritorhiza haematococci]|nr:hypothetical protein HK102_008156 [Quaeritorhiza haematococci]